MFPYRDELKPLRRPCVTCALIAAKPFARNDRLAGEDARRWPPGRVLFQ